jgi:hypothetical protein
MINGTLILEDLTAAFFLWHTAQNARLHAREGDPQASMPEWAVGELAYAWQRAWADEMRMVRARADHTAALRLIGARLTTSPE